MLTSSLKISFQAFQNGNNIIIMKGNDAEVKKIPVSLPSLCVKSQRKLSTRAVSHCMYFCPKTSFLQVLSTFYTKGKPQHQPRELRIQDQSKPTNYTPKHFGNTVLFRLDKATPTSVSDNIFECREASIKHESKITLFLVS